MKSIDQCFAALVALIWGTNFVFIRYGLDELNPFLFAALRFLFVAIPLIFVLAKPNCRWRYIISYGLLIGVGQFGLLFWVMQSNITPGLASLIIQSQVFFTILLALIFARERLNFYQVVSILFGLLGLGVVIIYTDGHTTIIGIGGTLLAALSWSAGNITVKHVGNINLLGFIAWSSVFAVPPLLIMALLTTSPAVLIEDIAGLSTQGWLVIVWQVIGNTLIGYGIWNWLLSRYSAAQVAPWALLVPIFGMLASSVMLAEDISLWKLFAATLILSGLAINTKAVNK